MPVSGRAGAVSMAAGDHSPTARVDGEARYFALACSSRCELDATVKTGVPAQAVLETAAHMKTAPVDLIRWLGLTATTVFRKAAAGRRLSPVQSERLAGLVLLIHETQLIVEESGESAGFDAPEWLGRWLARTNPALNGRLPSDYLCTAEGQNKLAVLIAQMQSGAYA